MVAEQGYRALRYRKERWKYGRQRNLEREWLQQHKLNWQNETQLFSFEVSWWRDGGKVLIQCAIASTARKGSIPFSYELLWNWQSNYELFKRSRFATQCFVLRLVVFNEVSDQNVFCLRIWWDSKQRNETCTFWKCYLHKCYLESNSKIMSI